MSLYTVDGPPEGVPASTAGLEPVGELEAELEPVPSPPVVTEPTVVRIVAAGLVLIALAVLGAATWLAQTDAPPLPGELAAMGPAALGALGALLAGTLTARARQ